MPKYLTIGYGDRAGYDRTPQPLRDAAHAHDQALLASGAIVGLAGAPVQVRNVEASGTEVLNAAFLSSDLPVAGFALIDAVNLEAAVALAARSPCAIAYGVVEVWPLLQQDVD